MGTSRQEPSWLPGRTDRSDTPVVGELCGGGEAVVDRGRGQGEAADAALPQGLAGQRGC